MPARDDLFALEQIGIKLGLDQIRALLAALGRPDAAYRSIVVGGTNGKGSVTAMIERGLRAAGYRTGRYTSPHLVAIEERVALDGDPILPAALDAAAARVLDAARALPAPPTFFEATTALALEIFHDAAIDVAVLEVGLGGRLDATNAVSSVGVALTAIDLDHQAYLGDTIEAIAAEKAALVKPGGAAVLGANPASVQAIVRRACTERDAAYVYAPDDVSVEPAVLDGRTVLRTCRTPHRTLTDVRLALRGRHQVDNAVTAIRTLETLTARGVVTIPDDAVRSAVEDVVWPARLEWRSWRGHAVLIDGAHNPAGAHALAAYIADTCPRRVPIVLAVMRDKDVRGIIAALAPVAAHFICTRPATARAAAPDDLAAVVAETAPQVPVSIAPRLADALATAIEMGAPVVVAGSLFLAGEVRLLLS